MAGSNKEQQKSPGTWPAAMPGVTSQSHGADMQRDEQLRELLETVNKLMVEVIKLKDTINDMKEKLEVLPISFSVAEVQERSYEETKQMILKFYQEHKGMPIYPDDVAYELGLDLRLTMQTVTDLIKEGKVEEAS
jgi:hypothetical protein